MALPCRFRVPRRAGWIWLVFFLAWAAAAPVDVVVDTDMALDDVRALALLLAAPDVRVFLIAASDGASSPESGCDNAAALLAYFDRANVPVAAGRTLGLPGPVWRDLAERLRWPEGFSAPPARRMKPPAADLIGKTVRRLNGPVVYLCLGPMTNLADALRRDPGLRTRIARVLYYGTAPGDPVADWNTSRDPRSVEAVYRSGIPIENLWQPKDRLITFDEAWLASIRAAATPAARLVAAVHDAPAVRAHIREGGLKIWDELVVLYLVQPGSFTFSPRPGDSCSRRLESFQAAEVRALYRKLLGVP